MTKYIFVTGGVVSSLGKGITAASLGRLLKNRGLEVTIQKFDPYINIDPGTMSPYQHGEVFVTDDGAETDLDLGHYERFIDINLGKHSTVTSGKVYASVLKKERRGDYNGGTVQVIPHITNEIKDRIQRAGRETNADIVITEVGGTVGDIESLPFLEAIRQMKRDLGNDNVLYLHCTLIPYIAAAGELKTKPTQHSVKELRSLGIQPNILVVRTDRPVPQEMKEKLALFCDVKPHEVIECVDADHLYEIPLNLQSQDLDDIVLEHFGIQAPEADMTDWKVLVDKVKNLKKSTKIALVGKYVELQDAYISVVEALKHAGYAFDTDIEVNAINAEHVTPENVKELLNDADGILVPGGFGDRGVEGKILAIQYARENNVPFLGICLGMQLATVEFARNVLGLEGAHSTELNPKTPYPIIDLLPEQIDVEDLGGTLRLGLYPCKLKNGSRAAQIYNDELVYEGNKLPSYADITDYSDFAFDNPCCDIIVTMNAYDDMDDGYTVHPFFYSDKLQSYAAEVVYIPWFEIDEIADDEPGMQIAVFFANIPGVVRADKIVLKSENMKNVYMNALEKILNEENLKIMKEKIYVSDIYRI